MKQKIFKLILILIIGGLGGVLADQFLLPFLADAPFFSQIEFIERAKDGTTIINKTERITITENTAAEEAIRRINPSITAVQTLSKINKLSAKEPALLFFPTV